MLYTRSHSPLEEERGEEEEEEGDEEEEVQHFGQACVTKSFLLEADTSIGNARYLMFVDETRFCFWHNRN